MIETSLNVTDYSTPPEVPEKQIGGKIILTFDIDTEVPENWNEEDIKYDIKRNLRDYIGLYDYEEIEIEL
jgi:hypothetical protein